MKSERPAVEHWQTSCQENVNLWEAESQTGEVFVGMVAFLSDRNIGASVQLTDTFVMYCYYGSVCDYY